MQQYALVLNISKAHNRAMDKAIDRDYARMMNELRAASQDWHHDVREPRKRSLSLRRRLTRH